jgi:hypothetical protein
MGRSAVCKRLDFVPPTTPRRLLSLLRCHTRNPVRLFRSGVFLCLDLCHLLLPCRLAGKLEVPSMWAGIFPGCVLSQPFWRPMFPLRPSQVVRLRNWRDYFPTQIPLWLGTSRAAQSLACIAHKSLEICERCRLWQRDAPATPEHSAAFLKEGVIFAG